MSDHLILGAKRNSASMVAFWAPMSLAALPAAAPMQASAQTVLSVTGRDAPGGGFLLAAQQGGNLDSGGSSDFAPGGGFLSALRGESCFSLHDPFGLNTMPRRFALSGRPVREEQLDSKEATGIHTVDFLAQGVALPTGIIDNFAHVMQADASWNPRFPET